MIRDSGIHRVRRLGGRGITTGVAVLLLAMGVRADQTGEESEAGSMTEAESAQVAEEELAPSLESNRQPLGPDPLVWPQWSGEEAAAFEAGRPVNLGGGLWTADRYPLPRVPGWTAAPGAEPAAEGGPIGWELMARYGGARQWCVDVQERLPAARRVRLEAHLAAHAAAAEHPVRLWVLASGQSIADSLDDAVLHQASFGLDAPGVLAVVPIDAPRSARFVVPPGLARRVPDWGAGVRGRLAEAAPPTDQLDQLALWLSLEAAALPALQSRAADEELRPGPVSAPALARGRGRNPMPWGWVTAAVLTGGGIAWIWHRRRLRDRRHAAAAPAVWLEIDHVTRLGGAHSGGSGAVAGW